MGISKLAMVLKLVPAVLSLEDVIAHTTVVGVPAKEVGKPSHRNPSKYMEHGIPLHYEI